MYQDIINRIKPSLEKILSVLKEELASLRTGRASPALVENIEIECYGTKMPLSQLAAIHSPEPRSVVIQPWDKSILNQIESEIRVKRPDFSPVLDGEIIRIGLPPLTEEKRKELARIVGQKIEEARINVRQKREQAWAEIQRLAKEGKIREDDKFRGKDELQKVIDEYNEKIEEVGERKKEEIMKV